MVKISKSTGLAITTFGVSDSGGTVRDIRNDFTNFDFATPRAVQDVTGIDKSAIERLLLLADFSGTLTGVFDNAATTSAHAVFATVPSTSVQRTINITITGTATSNLNQTDVLLTDYKITRAANGALTFSVPMSLGGGSIPTWS